MATHAAYKIHGVILILAMAGFASSIFGQELKHPGIDLYLAGKFPEAVQSLSQAASDPDLKKDASIWNYLGLAKIASNDLKGAKKAHETAVKLAPDQYIYQVNLAYIYFLLRETNKAQSAAKKAIAIDSTSPYAYIVRGFASLWEMNLDDAERDADQAIANGPANTNGYFLKSKILITRLGKNTNQKGISPEGVELVRQARDVLKTGVEKTKSNQNKKELQDELATMEVFYNHFAKTPQVSLDPNEVPDGNVTPIKIISKPRPGYAESARQAGVQGTVILAVLFAAEGKVSDILVLKGLPNGLTERAIAAAKKIQYTPQTKDGKPVPVVKQVEYTFSIY